MELLGIEFECIDNGMSVHIDNQPFKVIYKQEGKKQ